MIQKRQLVINWLFILSVLPLLYPVLSIMVKREVDRRFAEERRGFVEFAAIASEASPEALDSVVEALQHAADDELGPPAEHADGDRPRGDGDADDGADQADR